jgi:hypothetical protein
MLIFSIIFVNIKFITMKHLNLEEIGVKCPSALTTKPSERVSNHYRFIPTTEVINILNDEGWLPTQAIQSSTRKNNLNIIDYKKHMIRFRNPEHHKISKSIGDTFPEILLTNSHDGTSSFNFHVGLFRLVCSNGLVVSDKTFQKINIKHKGFDSLDVLETINTTTKSLPLIVDNVSQMMGKQLSKSQQLDFAKMAAEERWGNDKMIDLNQMLNVRRQEDAGNDLWSVFNRVQENMLQGGIVTVTPKENGSVRKSKSRSIRSIDQNIEINKMLWTLTESML